MAQTLTELYNLAAQQIGGRGNLVSSLQRSREVDVFNLWYPVVRPIILSAAHWPSSRKSATLGLLVERTLSADWTNTDPAPGARYAYIVPPDLIHPRALSTFNHFSMGMIGDTKCIFTHEESPVLSYTFDQTNTGLWEPQLFLLVAQALGAYTCMTLTGKPSRARELERQVNNALSVAQAQSAEFQNQPWAGVASWHSARGYYGPPDVARFVYPYGGLIAVGESANVK